MTPRSEVLLWAQRLVAKHHAPAHQILEVAANPTVDAATAAFHKIAKTAHPDLHRTTLSPDELELLTTAYARAAGAYQELRSQAMQTARMRPAGAPEAPAVARTRTPVSGDPTPGPRTPPGGSATVAAGAMSSKAQIYYRKVELSLRQGDLKSALLQLKMAIAADPQSAFLRSALAEVQAELAKLS